MHNLVFIHHSIIILTSFFFYFFSFEESLIWYFLPIWLWWLFLGCELNRWSTNGSKYECYITTLMNLSHLVNTSFMYATFPLIIENFNNGLFIPSYHFQSMVTSIRNAAQTKTRFPPLNLFSPHNFGFIYPSFFQCCATRDSFLVFVNELSRQI